MSSLIGGLPQTGLRNPTLPEITDRQIQLHHSTGHDPGSQGGDSKKAPFNQRQCRLG